MEQIIKEVKEMRRLQKAYFASRSPGNLTRAKSAEAKVDQLLIEYERNKTPQLGLGL